MRSIYRNFYYPDDEIYDSPYRAGLTFEEIRFSSADGTSLSGWFIHAHGIDNPRHAKGTVIHMHGNAQNMTAHWQFAEWVAFRGYNLFVFDYRGYGMSEGVTEPKGIFEDAVAALDYVRSRQDIDTNRMFVFGQSLGGMLAIGAASASPAGIRAVLAEAPAHSYSMWLNDKVPGSGDGLDDTWCATGWVARLSPIPLMLLHGTNDVVVDYSHSLALLEEAQQPKQLVTIEQGDHVDAMTRRYGSRYQDLMVSFFEHAVQD